MRILLINKFLCPRGGSETYVLELGKALEARGHEVQYFGMDDPERQVGNRVGAYAEKREFREKARALQARKVVYSAENRRLLRRVLEDFSPQVCHLNNFNYQLTPSILLEIGKWREETGKDCRILYTAHDYQLVCPNHMCRNRWGNCEKCLTGHYRACVRNRCIHDSPGKSLVGAVEGWFWRKVGVYRLLDTVVCCSEFQEKLLKQNPFLAGKTKILPNFLPYPAERKKADGEYVLYFGRFSREKGVTSLLEAAEALPDIPFVLLGKTGVSGMQNVQFGGYQQGETLKNWIRKARFTVCPSQWYENCPFSVLESLALGTPVLAALIGGLPELVSEENGALFESGDVRDLTRKIRQLWENPPKVQALLFDTVDGYAEKMEALYGAGEKEQGGKTEHRADG